MTLKQLRNLKISNGSQHEKIISNGYSSIQMITYCKNNWIEVVEPFNDGFFIFINRVSEIKRSSCELHLASTVKSS